MRAKKALPNSPRFRYVTRKAYELLLEMGFDHFPISPWEIIEQCPVRVVCLKWSEARTPLQSDDPLHLHELGAEARTLKMRGTNVYLMVYDDSNITNEERIRWTIMHELGHIFCGHLDNFEETALSRGGLKEKEKEILEVEAHYFASEMFAPSAVFCRYKQFVPEQLRLMCGISEQAAAKRCQQLYQREFCRDETLDTQVYRNFYPAMLHDTGKMLYSGIARIHGKPHWQGFLRYCRKCPSCKSYITVGNVKHCIYCGKTLNSGLNLIPPDEQETAEKDLLEDDGVNRFVFPLKQDQWPDENSMPRVAYCPICMNEEFSPNAKFCKVCGHPLYNFCLCEHKQIIPEARFCPDCGGESSFYHGYLEAEQRLAKLNDESNLRYYSEEWEEYRHWDYVLHQVSCNEAYALMSAAMYSRAFVDEDNSLIVYVLSKKAATDIRMHEGLILYNANKANSKGFRLRSMEVYSVQ